VAQADVDDKECAEFVVAIAQNQKLTSLNLSGNLIGWVTRSSTVDSR
jgi:hypothetical protein